MSDPNFPPSLDIHPLEIAGTSYAPDDQQKDIAHYGIAGRVWEASKPLIRYFTPTLQSTFAPSCPIFDRQSPRRIVELGSGQALASLHLAQYLDPSDTVILTDLPNVVPLCRQAAEVWSSKYTEAGNICVEPLAWGSDSERVQRMGPFDYILMCDLIYFPHLYPSLIYTLLQLTDLASVMDSTCPTFGPTIILSYFTRTLALEESFFDAFGKYFEMTPVLGLEGGAKIYLCRRWRVTDEYRLPPMDRVLNGATGIVRGRDFGLVDEMFASIEY